MFYNETFDNSFYPIGGNEQFVVPTMPMVPNNVPQQKPSSESRSSSGLFLPALILFAFTWLLQALATFLPYWSTYSGIPDSRAGLWDARNFNSTSIQNFYFPRSSDFLNLTGSISFTSAYTKGYIVTIQFMMTFNFAVMFIVLIFLTCDYIFSRDPPHDSRAFLNKPMNNFETGMRFGLLLYMIYVFGAFEFASWITYIASRHDNNWHMHVCFAFAVIISVFLIFVFVLYVLEFLKRTRKNRTQWKYWYGPYTQWAFFLHLTALIFLLTTICCPEWAYARYDTLMFFAEFGLFKQCLVTVDTVNAIVGFACVLSNPKTNEGWLSATQAFILMAYIFGTILWFLMIVYRKEFLHDQKGYAAESVSQPKFTYIMAGLILFFCFIFLLIGVSIFGAYVLGGTLIVNWAFILAVLAMVLFLIVGILLILDAVHSDRQSDINDDSFNSKIFPAPLNQRALMMEPLLKPNSVQPFQPLMIPPEAMVSPWNYPPGAYPMPMQGNLGAPIAQAGLTTYVQRAMINQPNVMSYLTPQDVLRETQLANQLRQHMLQQQRLNHNHERLLEQYQTLTYPRATEFRPFGSSVLPGHNYNDYLGMVSGSYGYDDTMASIIRNRVYASPPTTRKRHRKTNENETNVKPMKTVLVYDASSRNRQ